MAQALRFSALTSVTPESVAATMSQCSSAVTNFSRLLRIVAQPMQEFRKSPLVRVDAAAPCNAFKSQLVRLLGNLLGLGKGAMVAPKVVFVERLQAFAHRNHARSGRVERDGGNLAPSTPVALSASFVAAARAAIWSACDCVA